MFRDTSVRKYLRTLGLAVGITMDTCVICSLWDNISYVGFFFTKLHHLILIFEEV